MGHTIKKIALMGILTVLNLVLNDSVITPPLKCLNSTVNV